jgi:hypothetical protein
VNTADIDTAQILQALDHKERVLAVAEMQAKKAAESGAELAAAVYRFILEHPDSGRLTPLADAYSTFMDAHAGNFGPSL